MFLSGSDELYQFFRVEYLIVEHPSVTTESYVQFLSLPEDIRIGASFSLENDQAPSCGVFQNDIV